MSPPYSAGHPPRNMSYGFPSGPPPTFLDPAQTQKNPHDPFMQITPPGAQEGILFGSQLQEQQLQQHMTDSIPPYTPSNRVTPDHAAQASSRRVRKNDTRQNKALSVDHDSDGDLRRSKVLERNRIAASKCRQKKKAQQKELEQEARGKQTHNSMLLEERKSHVEELEYLRGHVKRMSKCCECMRTRDGRSYSLTNSGIEELALKSEPSSPHSSPLDSLVTSADDTFSEPNETEEEGTARSEMNAVNDDELGALLTDSINQEPVDEGSR